MDANKLNKLPKWAQSEFQHLEWDHGSPDLHAVV